MNVVGEIVIVEVGGTVGTLGVAVSVIVGEGEVVGVPVGSADPWSVVTGTVTTITIMRIRTDNNLFII
jgi:hypothetical protein